jgi:hypothetical protein
MWNTFKEKIKAGVLAFWSQTLWFVLGTLLGVMVLGGLASCSTVNRAWEGTKDTGRAVVGGAVGVGSAVVGTAEGVVRGAVNDVNNAMNVVTGKERQRMPKRNGKKQGK